jgi:spore germination protein Q
MFNYPGTQGFSFAGSTPVFPTSQMVAPPYPPMTGTVGGAFQPTGGMFPPTGGGFQPTGGMFPPVATGGMVQGAQPVFEESYIENILRLNLGKIATIYMTFENNSQWNAKVFTGRLEAAGRDHIIISDPQSGLRYLLLMVNLDYITFPEELNYEYPATTLPAPVGR